MEPGAEPASGKGGRTLEIFLDRLASAAIMPVQHLFDPHLEAVLDEPDRLLRDQLRALSRQVTPAVRATAAWRALDEALRKLGLREAPEEGTALTGR